MTLRKMCAVLAVLSALTVMVGVWALVNADKAADGDPAQLADLPDAELAEGKPVTLQFDAVLPYVCYIAENEGDNTEHRYRYYPVQYRNNPARFVLLCVTSERFDEMERYVAKSAEGKSSVEGYLRKSEPRTQAAVDELIAAMTGLDEKGNADLGNRFLTYYVEPATLRSRALQRDIGWILIIGGLVMGSVGVVGIFAFRWEPAPEEEADGEPEETAENAEETRE